MPEEKAPNPPLVATSPVPKKRPNEDGAREPEKKNRDNERPWWWRRLTPDGRAATIIGVIALIATIAVPAVVEWVHFKKEAAAGVKSEPTKPKEPNKGGFECAVTDGSDRLAAPH